MRTNVDVDMIHIPIGHRPTVRVIGDQPLDDGLLARTGREIDGVAVTMTRRLARARNRRARPARRHELHRTELPFDPPQQFLAAADRQPRGASALSFKLA